MSPTAPDILDRLPDEILQIILELVVHRPAPCYLEYLFDPTRFLHTRAAYGDQDKQGWMKVEDSEVRRRGPGFDQAPHATDWRSVNGTCRRFRRIGKVSFFQGKVFVMTTYFLKQLRRGEAAPLTPSDQAMALQHIRTAALLMPSLFSPSLFITVPVFVAPLTGLKRLVLMLTYRSNDSVDLIMHAMADPLPMPEQLSQGLLDIGLPQGLMLEIALNPDRELETHTRNLANYIYPMLRIKADMRARSTASKEKGDA